MIASRASARFSLSYSPDQSDAIARRQLHLVIDLFDRVFHRGPQIPASHVEGYRHIPGVLFPVDVICAIPDLYLGELRQRNALSGRRKQANVVDGLLRIAIGPR
jgi:hypothetical protein